MAPFEAYNERNGRREWFAKVAIRSGGTDATVESLMEGQDAAVPRGGATVASYTVYLGIGLGVGGAFLVGLIVVAALTLRKRRNHKSKIEALEVEEALQSAQAQHVREMPRPTMAFGCGTLLPLNGRASWDALSSNETVNEPEPVAKVNKRNRASVSLPKRFKQRGIPLKKLRRLTAILENPTSRNSPSIAVSETVPAAVASESTTASHSNSKAYDLQKSDEGDVFVCPGSPKPEVLPSFAIRSPGRYGADIANNNNTRAYRSRSVGAMRTISSEALVGSSTYTSGAKPHARSISLGAPPTGPPQRPVPPLPVINPHDASTQYGARQGVCVSRLSSSSQKSASSFALVATPILMIPEQNQSIESPSVEEVVAQDTTASLKSVPTNQWQNPLTIGSRRVTDALPTERTKGTRNRVSMSSNIARYSTEGVISHRVQLGSFASSDSLDNSLSSAQIGSADQVSIIRVSSENSLQSNASIRKFTTPRKVRQTSVSESGSPAERRKNGILRNISGNSIGPSRRHSTATQDSTRSSSGNPFQLDQQSPKVSALKGSPNARKGHRRQNCVRISTLTPQILGPPPSRPTSPSIMHGIEEEAADGDENAVQPGVRFVSNQRQSRPPSASYFALNFRPQPLRASLTPSSPTLSVWTAPQEHDLPSQPSDSQLSGSTGTRSMSRQSNRSSLQSIPSFPSPVKIAICTTQLSQPVPEFHLSRPSLDFDENEMSSPYETNMPSSSPLSVSQDKEYDPSHPPCPAMTISALGKRESDPASPMGDEKEPERSSVSFPFATSGNDQNTDDGIRPYSISTSYRGELRDTLPISPKTMPEGFQAFFDKRDIGTKPVRASEKLTSANASSVMASIPSRVDFPGASTLPPPHEDESHAQITSGSRRERVTSNAAYLVPLRPAPPPPSSSKDICVPSPLHVAGKISPGGPRTQPAQSVLKNAMALRRMNSEVNTVLDRKSRRFMRLGREASPLLPWIGIRDPNESCAAMNELFDFDFAPDTISGVEEYGPSDDVDMAEMERKLDGAQADFNESQRDEAMQEDIGASVWDDGEKYWHLSNDSTIGFAMWSPVSGQITSKNQVVDSPKSVQNTPKSLYDADGFLRA